MDEHCALLAIEKRIRGDAEHMSLLPNLPKQIRGQEADFGLQFRKWWESPKGHLPGEIELKDTKGKDSLPFNAFSPDQEVIARMATEGKGVLVRRTVGTVGGADYSGLVNCPYWLAIKYPGGFEIISVGTFLLERERSKRKSLTSVRAREISTITVRQ